MAIVIAPAVCFPEICFLTTRSLAMKMPGNDVSIGKPASSALKRKRDIAHAHVDDDLKAVPRCPSARTYSLMRSFTVMPEGIMGSTCSW